MEHIWWKNKIVYQIYPRSFCDSNGDGIGDIRGIISKLDYIRNLGAGIIWLSPLYRSPNDDNGYDISDYCAINPEYGTLEDFRDLTSEAEKRGMSIIMDLVINHTSEQHRWFAESRKSVDNPYRDYYYWRKEPNNWTSFFGGPAWKYDEQTGEYVLHLFSEKMPDLNFHNPAVLREVTQILRFWLNLGIKGFRCDVINVIYKTLKNGETNPKGTLPNGKKRFILTGREHYLTQPGCLKILHSLNEEIFSPADCFTVGETVMVTPGQAAELTAADGGALRMVFAFEHMDSDCINNKWFRLPFSPSKFMKVLYKWQKELDWNANYFENHDQIRSVSRYGDAVHYRAESAKMLAVLLCTLRGTPYIYQGQELGMTNSHFASLDDIRDVESHTIYKTARKMHIPSRFARFLVTRSSRDHARTPMQWDNSPHAGFMPAEASNAEPWLAVNPNFPSINAQNQLADSNSVLAFYKKLITFRSKADVLIDGSFTPVKSRAPVFAYLRESGTRRLLVVLNFSNRTVKKPGKNLRKILGGSKNGQNDRTVILSNYGKLSVQDLDELFPYEAAVIDLKK